MSSTYQAIMGPFFQAQQNLAQALRQHAELEQAKQQFQADLALRQQQEADRQNASLATLLSQGGKLVDAGGNVNVQAPTPAMVRDPNSGQGAISPDGRLVMNPNGTGIQHALNLASGMTMPVTADQDRTVSFGGRRVQIPTQQEQTDADVARKTADYNVGKIRVTQAMSDATGGIVPVDSLLDPSHAAFIYQTMKANNQAEKQPLPERAGMTTDGRPITFERSADGKYKYTVGDQIPGAAEPPAAPKQLTPYERINLDRQRKQDAQDAEYNNVLNDVLVRSNGDPAQARKLLLDDAAQSTVANPNAARRQLGAATKQLIGLQGKPDEVQALMTVLNGPGQSAPSTAQRNGLGGGAPAPAAAPSPQPSTPPLPSKPVPRLPVGNGKKLTDSVIAQRFMDAAGGDRQKARQLAQQSGWKL